MKLSQEFYDVKFFCWVFNLSVINGLEGLAQVMVKDTA